MSRGFTLFDIAFVLLLLFLAGLVAVPGILDRTRITDEARAVKALQWVAAAQAHLRTCPADLAVDRNGDGKPEYGFLADLLHSTPATDPWGAPPFSGEVGKDILELPGFYVTILLPSADGAPLMNSGAARVDAQAAARTFGAIAWPIEAGRTGYRAYYVNHSLLVYEHPNRDRALSGPMLPTLPSPVLITRNARTGTIAPPPAPAQPWFLLLSKDQRRLLEERLGRKILPPDGK